MRLLLTSQPIYSHLVPALIPLARQASAAGHEVAVATAAAMADDLAALGVAHLPLPGVAGQDELRTSPELARRYGLPEQLMAPGSRRVAQAVAEQISLAYAGPMALRFADELLVAAERFKPDVIAHEPSEYGGYLAAEKLGIPHATVDMMPFQADELPLVAGSLDASRVRLGLPPTGDPWYPHRYLTAGLIPLAWYPPRLRSRTLRHYRLPADTTPTPLPVGFPPPRDGLPVVLAGLGSLVLTLPGIPELLPVLVRALGALPCHAVLSLGGQGQLAAGLEPVPENVTVLPFVPQQAMLPACDLFVTHAGFNSVVEAVAAGTPMVALPVLADQPSNARRVADLGIGEWLDIESLDPAALTAACARVLSDAAYARRAAGLRKQLDAGNGLDALVADLAALS